MLIMANSETITFNVDESRVRNLWGVPREARITFQRDLPAKMRDGVSLMTNLFRPEGEGRYPVIISLSPFGKDTLPGDHLFHQMANSGLVQTSEWTAFESPDPVFWVPNGYAVISADCRATNRSGGDYFDHSSLTMAQDFHDLVEWAAGQDWSDGNVGATGVSYLALTQWLGAAENPPHLKAIIPWEGFNDYYREHIFHGDIPDTGFVHNIWGRGTDPETGWVAAGARAENIMQEQARRPLMEDFWRAKHPHLPAITVPTYVGTSWATAGLHTRGSIEGFKQIASDHKWLEVHGRKEWESYYARESMERQRRFLDQFLKGTDSGILDLPRVRVEIRERFYEGRTLFAGDFPIPGTEYRQLHLDASNATLSDAPVADEAEVRYAALPGSSEPDGAEWRYTFARPMDIVGHMKLKLWVGAKAADDLDLHVGIRKYDRHGNQVFMLDFQHNERGLAAIGWLRVSHRELDEQKSTPFQPWYRHQTLRKLKPGEIVPVEIEILPSGTGFAAGEQLALVVQGHDIIALPSRFRHDDTVNQGDHVIHAGGKYDSHLLVPVLPQPKEKQS